jgi:hypothetical protein
MTEQAIPTGRPRRSRRLRDQLAADTPSSPFLPLLLVTCAMVALLSFQAWQIYKDRSVLADLRKSQLPAYREAQRLQDQLEGVAAGTAMLARQGNQNARMIVAALRSRGITIDPDARRSREREATAD